MVEGIDYCLPCYKVYQDKCEGVQHCLQHLLSLEMVALISDKEPPKPSMCHILAKIFSKARELNKELLDAMLFDEDDEDYCVPDGANTNADPMVFVDVEDDCVPDTYPAIP